MHSPFPQKLYVELTTRCNLSCAKCVKFSEGSDIVEKDMDFELYTNLVPTLAHVKTLILNGIGEPLLHPRLFEILKVSRESMEENAEIGFQSNGLLINDQSATQLIDSGLSTICLSVDDMAPPSLGNNHSFSGVASAVASLQNARNKTAKSLKIGLEVVLKKETLGELPQLVTWAGEKGIDYILTTHLIAYSVENEQSTLFNPNPPEATSLYRKYHKEAGKIGINLKEEYEHYQRFAGTRSPQAVRTLFAELQEEIKSLETALNLDRLLKTNISVLHELSSVQKEVQEIANRYDLQISFPPHQALNHPERVCPFMQEHASFIGVSGEVMPCHFLWHSYKFRLNRDEIQVERKSFGNVRESLLENIWNKNEYTHFRQAARTPSYSPCWSCPLAPCPTFVNDNISNAHDCYGSAVPCGHCMWSQGGFTCL